MASLDGGAKGTARSCRCPCGRTLQDVLSNSVVVPVLRSYYPAETSLDAGVAKSPTLDKFLRDQLKAKTGARLSGSQTRRLGSDAEWVATDAALYYAWPPVIEDNPGWFVRAEWSDILDLSLGRAGRPLWGFWVIGARVRNIRVETRNGSSFRFQTGVLTAQSLYAIAQERLPD